MLLLVAVLKSLKTFITAWFVYTAVFSDQSLTIVVWFRIQYSNWLKALKIFVFSPDGVYHPQYFDQVSVVDRRFVFSIAFLIEFHLVVVIGYGDYNF